MAGVSMVAMIATGPGQTVIVSQFNTAIRNDLGLSELALSTAYMIGTLSAAAPLVFVGKASDRFGPRVVMGGVALLFGAACVGIGFVGHVATLTIAFFLLRFLGQGALGLVSGHALAMWFERKLGTVNGFKLVGTQLAFAFMPALALALIDAHGWRQAYAILGVGVWVLVLPLVAFVSRDRPEQVGQLMDGDAAPAPDLEIETTREPDAAFTLMEALGTRSFWIVTISIVLNGLIGTALLFHIQPLLETKGLDPEASGAVVRTWSLTMMAAVLPCGAVAEQAQHHDGFLVAVLGGDERLVPPGLVAVGALILLVGDEGDDQDRIVAQEALVAAAHGGLGGDGVDHRLHRALVAVAARPDQRRTLEGADQVVLRVGHPAIAAIDAALVAQGILGLARAEHHGTTGGQARTRRTTGHRTRSAAG